MTDEIPDSAFRLKWERTWPELSRKLDFIVRDDDGRQLCRIYRVNGGPQDGRWLWTAASRDEQLRTGYEETPRDAALSAEAAYFRDCDEHRSAPDSLP